jgi:hypothetical protein
MIFSASSALSCAFSASNDSSESPPVMLVSL